MVSINQQFLLPPKSNSLSTIISIPAYNLWNVDINGEYVWCEDTVFNRSGEVINDISDKYSSFQLGNGYVLVKEISSGYEQKIEKMGVIDGYGNEIIPISEELSELLGEELLNIGTHLRYNKQFISFRINRYCSRFAIPYIFFVNKRYSILKITT